MFAYPLIGKGVGANVAAVVFSVPGGQRTILTDAHNTWLNLGAQAGIAGFAAIIWLTFHFARTAARHILNQIEGREFTTAFGVAFLGAFVAQGSVGSFEDARHLWVLMGLFVAAARIESTELSKLSD
jgi:hypothetical protein